MTTTIDTKTGRLALRWQGDGAQTLLLWPSIFADHAIHRDLAQRLDGQARVLLIDGFGHGASGAARAGADIADHARALEQVCAALGLERLVVGGTSWGGLVAAEFALQQPDRVAGVVLMNLPVRMSGTGPNLIDRLIVVGARLILRSATYRNGIARSFFAEETRAVAPAALLAFHAMLRSSEPRALVPAAASVLLRDSRWRGAALAERMARIAAPVLMIAGQDDTFYPLDDQRRAAACLRMGQLVSVAGRHISPVDSPETVANAVTSFLSGIANEAIHWALPKSIGS